MKYIKRLLLLFSLFMMVLAGKAQYYPYNPYMNPGYAIGQQLGNAIGQTIARNSKYGRNQLRKQIKKWGACNNASLSIEHGAVAVYGRNGYFCSSSVDSRISSKLKSINKAGGDIVDINIAENGKYIIVYNGGKDWEGVIPTELNSALDNYVYGTLFRSISFNESGTYAIVTSTGFESNNSVYQSFYDDNGSKYGDLLSVNICGDGAVYCYTNKTLYCGYIPRDVESAIRDYIYTAKFVKFNKHGDYIICTKDGSYSYAIGDADAGGNASMICYDYAKERKRIAKERAFAKYGEETTYKFNEKFSSHTTSIYLGMIPNSVSSSSISIRVLIGSSNNSVPTLDFTITHLGKDNFDDFISTIPIEGFSGMDFEVCLTNGEILKTNTMLLQNVITSISVSAQISLKEVKSNKRTLYQNFESVRYLSELFSYNNIKYIVIDGKYKFDMSSMDTKDAFLCCFSKLAEITRNNNFFNN